MDCCRLRAIRIRRRERQRKVHRDPMGNCGSRKFDWERYCLWRQLRQDHLRDWISDVRLLDLYHYRGGSHCRRFLLDCASSRNPSKGWNPNRHLPGEAHYKEELAAYALLLKDWKIWALYVVGLSSEMCLSFQSTMSAHTFNLRTRSLVNLMFWLIQIPATLLLQPIFDAKCRRRTRALMGATYLLVIVLTVMIVELGELFRSAVF